MFNLSGSEIIFLIIIALVVLGPDKLPDAMRKAGKAYGDFKRMTTGFQTEMKSVLDEPMRELRETAELAKKSAMFDTSMLTGTGSPATPGTIKPQSGSMAAVTPAKPAPKPAVEAKPALEATLVVEPKPVVEATPVVAPTPIASAPPAAASPVVADAGKSATIDSASIEAPASAPVPESVGDRTSRRLAAMTPTPAPVAGGGRLKESLAASEPAPLASAADGAAAE